MKLKLFFLASVLFLPLISCSNTPSEPIDNPDDGSGADDTTTYTINVSSWEEADSSHITRVSQGFTFTTSGDNLSGLITGGSLRIYAHMHLTISSGSIVMTKIVFACSEAKYSSGDYKWGAGDLSTTTGQYTFSNDQKSGTWVGTSSNIMFDTNQQVRISAFEITIAK